MSEKNAVSKNKDNNELTEVLVRWLKLIATLLALIAIIAGSSAAWTTLGARATALERADEVFSERVERIEAEQSQMREILVKLQEGQAGMDAKLDMLVADRQRD